MKPYMNDDQWSISGQTIAWYEITKSRVTESQTCQCDQIKFRSIQRTFNPFQSMVWSNPPIWNLSEWQKYLSRKMANDNRMTIVRPIQFSSVQFKSIQFNSIRLHIHIHIHIHGILFWNVTNRETDSNVIDVDWGHFSMTLDVLKSLQVASTIRLTRPRYIDIRTKRMKHVKHLSLVVIDWSGVQSKSRNPNMMISNWLWDDGSEWFETWMWIGNYDCNIFQIWNWWKSMDQYEIRHHNVLVLLMK
jgi:hypothetical protein